jgi:hypothetical protein
MSSLEMVGQVPYLHHRAGILEAEPLRYLRHVNVCVRGGIKQQTEHLGAVATRVGRICFALHINKIPFPSDGVEVLSRRKTRTRRARLRALGSVSLFLLLKTLYHDVVEFGGDERVIFVEAGVEDCYADSPISGSATSFRFFFDMTPMK